MVFFSLDQNGNENPTGNSSLYWVPGEPNMHENIFNGVGLCVENLPNLFSFLKKIKHDNVIVSAENFSWIFKIDEIKNLKKRVV